MSTIKNAWAAFVLWLITPALALRESQANERVREPESISDAQVADATAFVLRAVADGRPKALLQQDLEALLELFQQITRCTRPQGSCGQGQGAGRTAP